MLYIVEIAFYVVTGRFLCNALEYPVEIGDAVEAAVIGYRGNAVIVAVRQFFAGFVDTYFVEEGDEGVQGMFLKIAAEGLWRHVRLFGYIFQRDGFVILLHDVVVNGPDADAFVFAVSGGLSTGGQGL